MFQQESKVYIGVLVAACILLVMMATFLLLAIRYHRSRKRLHSRQLMAEISGIEKDRKRIAADLHDDIGSLLTYSKLRLSNIAVEGNLKNDIADVRGKLDKMHEALLIITNDLLPNSLQQNGLLYTISEYLDESCIPLGIEVHYTAGPVEQLLPASCRIHLYRVVTELVQNTIKHSGAGSITLGFMVTANKLVMQYSDNGKGFSLSRDLRKNAGLGLRNINSRVELMNGNLFFDAAPGKGIHCTIQIPVNEYPG